MLFNLFTCKVFYFGLELKLYIIPLIECCCLITTKISLKPDAMKPEEFAAYGPVQATLSGFISVYEELEEYMAQP